MYRTNLKSSTNPFSPRFCLVAAKLWQQVAAQQVAAATASEIAASNKAQRQRHHSKTSTPASNTQHWSRETLSTKSRASRPRRHHFCRIIVPSRVDSATTPPPNHSAITRWLCATALALNCSAITRSKPHTMSESTAPPHPADDTWRHCCSSRRSTSRRSFSQTQSPHEARWGRQRKALKCEFTQNCCPAHKAD